MSRKSRMSFSDEKVKTGFGNERPETYKAKHGQRDRIRILTMPGLYGAANVDFIKSDEKGNRSESGFKANSLLTAIDNEDLLYDALIENDKDAIDKAKRLCPLFDRGFRVKPRFPVLIHVISSSASGSKREKKVDNYEVWDLPATNYSLFRDVQESLPTSKKTKKPLDIRQVEIFVTCQDEKFQKVNLNAITSKSDMQSTLTESYDGAIESGVMVDDAPEKVSQAGPYDVIDILGLIEADTEQELTDSLDRAAKTSKDIDEDDDIDDFDSEEDDDLDDEPTPRKKRSSKKKSSRKKTTRKSSTSAKRSSSNKKKSRSDDEDEEELDTIADELDELLDDDDFEEDDDGDEDDLD